MRAQLPEQRLNLGHSSESLNLTIRALKSSRWALQYIISLNNFLLQQYYMYTVQFSSVQSLSHVRLFETPWNAACQASLSTTNSRSLLKFMPIESVVPSNHLILWCPLLLPPSIFPSISVFSNESVLCIRWPKYWSFSFNISSWKNTQDWSPLGWTGWISLQSKGLSRVVSKTTIPKHQFFNAQLSL